MEDFKKTCIGSNDVVINDYKETINGETWIKLEIDNGNYFGFKEYDYITRKDDLYYSIVFTIATEETEKTALQYLDIIENSLMFENNE